VTVGGETVVDLWGGIADPGDPARRGRATRSSIVFSCTKGATALCAHVLASRGMLDLDAPVTPSCGPSSPSTARTASPRA
jgi:CubicO group peptidase (beta-lactamase class C family)